MSRPPDATSPGLPQGGVVVAGATAYGVETLIDREGEFDPATLESAMVFGAVGGPVGAKAGNLTRPAVKRAITRITQRGTQEMSATGGPLLCSRAARRAEAAWSLAAVVRMLTADVSTSTR